ncbi:MAG TPA: radical SAM protein, partial [Clostridiaceae bacterium]|nr:radical SAM protein [Clostridiaceae bacterium]
QCLEIIERYSYGLTILTKSARILRDIDILKAINEKTRCVVQMTLTTYDEDLCRVLEPNVSTTAERFGILEILRDEGISAVVWLSPILPFINDNEENLRGILDYCIRAKVRGILCFGFGTTMREGSREYFFGKLDEHFPGMKQRYIRTYGMSYECMSPNNQRLYEIFKDVCLRHDILYRPDEVFGYLKKFEIKERQISLFDLEER